MRRHIRFRPSKEAQVFSRVFSGVFALIGIGFVAIGVTQIIPDSGLFGIVWTGMAAFFAGIGIYGAVSKKGISGLGRWGMEIEDETFDPDPDPAETEEKTESVEARLKRLEELRAKRLITAGEYEEKRKEILKEL